MRGKNGLSEKGLLLARSWNGELPASIAQPPKDDVNIPSIAVSNGHYLLYNTPRSRHYLDQLIIYHPDATCNTFAMVLVLIRMINCCGDDVDDDKELLCFVNCTIRFR